MAARIIPYKFSPHIASVCSLSERHSYICRTDRSWSRTQAPTTGIAGTKKHIKIPNKNKWKIIPIMGITG
jgi:hypothetical protein